MLLADLEHCVAEFLARPLDRVAAARLLPTAARLVGAVEAAFLAAAETDLARRKVREAAKTARESLLAMRAALNESGARQGFGS